MKPQDEVKFFDGFVEEHGEYDVLGEGAYKQLLLRFGALCKPRPREKCVDCGCGTGEVFICRKLVENGALILLTGWLLMGRGRAFCAHYSLIKSA